MKRIRSHYNVVATVFFFLIIVAAHFLVPDNYDLTKNTISDLGSQGYDYKPLMQVGFIFFGLILILGISLNEINLRTTPLLIYGFCVALTGIFCAKPFVNTEPFSTSEMQSILHPFFAQAAGIAFSIGILMQVFYTNRRSEKIIHVLFLAAVIGLSVTFGLYNDYPGIVQRVLYLVSFIWLAIFYKV